MYILIYMSCFETMYSPIYNITGNKDINEECEANIQCTGTEHASVCGENQTCTCDKGFIRLREECVSGRFKIDKLMQ